LGRGIPIKIQNREGKGGAIVNGRAQVRVMTQDKTKKSGKLLTRKSLYSHGDEKRNDILKRWKRRGGKRSGFQVKDG